MRRVGAVVALLAVVLGGVVAVADRPSAARDRLTVVVVGDSLMLQSREEITTQVERGYDLVGFDAENARRTDEMVQRAIDLVEQTDPDVVLIGLGANDAGQGRSDIQMRAAVAAILGAHALQQPCVRWFDLKTTPVAVWPSHYVSRATAYNRVLAEEMSEHPNATTISISRWAPRAGAAHFLSDGLHFSPAGEDEAGLLARQAVVGCDPSRTSGQFWDVPDDHPFRADIEWVASQGVANGYANDTFGTVLGSFTVPVSRMAMSAFLYRLAGSPPFVAPAVPSFGDVPGSHVFFDEVEWMAASGISSGTPASPLPLFKPTVPVSRMAMAAFLHRVEPMVA